VITRSIRISIEKSNLDIYDERIPEFDEDFRYIRDLLYVFGLSHGLAVQKVYQNQELKPEGVRHRYWELYKPLAAIAYYVGEDYFKQVKSYIEEKVANEKKRRLFEDEDAIAISALVRLIKTTDFYSIAQITKAIREEIGAQDIIKKDMNQVEYVAHYDEAYKHINGRWVTNFLRNVNLPRKRKKEDDDGRHGGARGRYFKVPDIIDQAIRMNVVENILGVNTLITTGKRFGLRKNLNRRKTEADC